MKLNFPNICIQNFQYKMLHFLLHNTLYFDYNLVFKYVNNCRLKVEKKLFHYQKYYLFYQNLSFHLYPFQITITINILQNIYSLYLQSFSNLQFQIKSLPTDYEILKAN